MIGIQPYRIDALLDGERRLEISAGLSLAPKDARLIAKRNQHPPVPGATCVTWIPLSSIDEAVRARAGPRVPRRGGRRTHWSRPH